jgi:hypothetical protein
MRLVLLLFAVVGCAHTPRGRYDAEARRLCAGDVCYRVGELPGWRVVRQKGTEIAFFDESRSAIAQANATCRQDSEVASLNVLTRHLLIGYTDVQVRHEEKVPLAAREALHTVLDARLDGVPVVLDLYVLKRNGCIFDLSLAAPPDRYSSASGDFARFVNGFAQESSS